MPQIVQNKRTETILWDCTPPTPPIRGDNALTVARWFGVAPGNWKPYRKTPGKRPRPAPVPLPRFALQTPAPGAITLVTGPSGAGKSTLLREWKQTLSPVTRRFKEPCFSRESGENTVLRTVASQNHSDLNQLHEPSSRIDEPNPVPRVIDLSTLEIPDVPLVDLFPGQTLKETLGLLSRVGLAEVWTYLRTPAELSDGQRWRLKLALAVHRAKDGLQTVLLADEFTAVLDRITARVVARGLRKLIDANAGHLSALVATAHDDLHSALQPDTQVNCDFTRVTVLSSDERRASLK